MGTASTLRLATDFPALANLIEGEQSDALLEHESLLCPLPLRSRSLLSSPTPPASISKHFWRRWLPENCDAHRISRFQSPIESNNRLMPTPPINDVKQLNGSRDLMVLPSSLSMYWYSTVACVGDQDRCQGSVNRVRLLADSASETPASPQEAF